MFWNEKKGLRTLPVSSKIAVTSFLLLMGLAYIFGFLNIYFSYSPVDQRPGLSIDDIRFSFYGTGSGTVLEKAVDGNMKSHFKVDNDYNLVKEWMNNGAGKQEWDSVSGIFESSCVICHSSENETAGVVLETYPDVVNYLKEDHGKSVSRLISLSHNHMFAIATAVFLLVFIFSFTLYSEKIKIIVYSISFFAIAADIGSWWLAKLSGSLAFLVVISGITLGITFVLLTILPLYELWLKKASDK